MGTGSFYRIMNKENGRETQKIYNWLRLHSLVWGEKAQSCPGVRGLADCVSDQLEHLQDHEHYLSFGLLMWHSGQEWLHLRPRNLLHRFSFSVSSFLFLEGKVALLFPSVLSGAYSLGCSETRVKISEAPPGVL